MARDGSDVYSAPSGTAAVSGQTISSTKFNQIIADLVADLNLDRPIAAGGTGASTASAARANLGVPATADVLTLAGQNQAVTGGATITSLALNSGNAVTTGTLTLDVGDCGLQHYTNGGAHTLAPGTTTGSCIVEITNNGSAGAITTSGFTIVRGDVFTTTNGESFACTIVVLNSGESILSIVAMQ